MQALHACLACDLVRFCLAHKRPGGRHERDPPRAFRHDAGGFFTSRKSEAKSGVFAKPAKLLDDQVQVARFMNMLNRYYGNEAYREQASHAMRYLASASAEMMRPLPGVLLAVRSIVDRPGLTVGLEALLDL